MTERKKTMPGSGGFHNTEVLNCQQQCENDVIKDSWKEEPGEYGSRSPKCEGEDKLFADGV